MIVSVPRWLGRRQALPRGDQEAAPDWRRVVKARVIVSACVLCLWAVGIEARLVYLQIVAHDELTARAERQQQYLRRVPAERGEIVDRQGRVLAMTADVDTVTADPTQLEDAAAAVVQLCGALACSPTERADWTRRFAQPSEFAYVRRRVPPDEARRVADLNLKGIGFLKESRRYFPNRELAAQILGYVGSENNGLAGIEYAYDTELRGQESKVLVQADGRRRSFTRTESGSTAGASLRLTIDQNLQHMLEKELSEAVRANRALAASAIIQDPKTGEILALANVPTFNPNALSQSNPLNRRNRAAQDVYEPGSTFKLVTAAAAIEERVMPIDTMLDVSGGQIRFGARVVSDTHAYGILSFTDVIVKSSNVGAIRIGLQVGAERLTRYVQRFGFGERTSSAFPGESAGIVWDAAGLNDSALASVSMGYQIAVTPIQMVTAVSSIANGGELFEPHVVQAVKRDGEWIENAPTVRRRTVSPETAATLTSIMEQVVERGTATAAKIPGFTVAGKTGTAAKLVDGRYSKSDYYASFVGFVPSNDPAVTILVVVDSPKANGYYGGTVAAPVFQRVAEATLRYLGVPSELHRPPPVLVSPRPAAPAWPTPRRESNPVISLVADAQPGTVPDLRGMTARDASRLLVALGFGVSLAGSGVVVAQDPPPGTPVFGGSARLDLDRVVAHGEGPAQP